MKQYFRLANDLNIYRKQVQKVTDRKRATRLNHTQLLYDPNN